MRMIAALPFLMLAACDVEKDPQNDQTTIEFNEQRIESTAENLGNAAEEVASDVANAAETAGQKIENEVEGIDVDVDVNRRKSDNAN